MPSSGVQTCARSEEHTSELQSHDNLVCRLLLEKNKIALSSRCLDVGALDAWARGCSSPSAWPSGRPPRGRGRLGGRRLRALSGRFFLKGRGPPSASPSPPPRSPGL